MINQTWITTWDHLSIQCLTVSYQVASYYYNPSDWHSLIFLSIACIHTYIYICLFFPDQFSVKPKHFEMGTMGTMGTSKASRNTDSSWIFLPLQMWIHQVKTCKLQSPEIFVFHQFFLNGLWQGFWVLNANFQQLWGRFGSLMWEIVVVSWAWLGWAVTWGINDPLGVEVFLHHWFFDRKFRWKAMQIL